MIVKLLSMMFLLIHVKSVLTFREQNLPQDCIENPSGTVRCGGTVPAYIPNGITEVMIDNYKENNISKDTFSGGYWWNVSVLDVNVNTIVDFALTDYNFYSLKKVERLGIHSQRLWKIPINTFQGLDRLKELDLSSCTSVSVHELEVALLFIPYNLEYLRLDQVGERSFAIDQNFIDMAFEKRISKLSLSGTNLLCIGPLNHSTTPSYLKYLDISNSTFLPTKTCSKGDIQVFVNWYLNNLEVLNVSSMPYTFLNLDYIAIGKLSGKSCQSIFDGKNFNAFLPKLKILVINDFFKYSVILNYSLVNLTCIQTKYRDLKTISAARNNIEWLNTTFLLPPELAINELDFSSNTLKYLSPNCIGQFRHLKFLNLENNSLGYMEEYEDFSSIFSELRQLTYLNIASNEITKLPSMMLISNSELRYLDLHGNRLEAVDFHIEHLNHLLSLNLSFNNINALDETTTDVLDKFLTASDQSNDRITDIDLRGNPIVCNCKNVPFIKWILTNLSPKQEKNYECLLEGEQMLITKEVVGKSEFLCYRTMVTTLSTVFSVTIVTGIFVSVTVIIYRKKKKKRKHARDIFIEDFLAGRFNENYIAFITYASEDADEIVKAFCRLLGERLKDTLQTEQRLVSTGDLHIVPGHPIMDEVLRCVTDACVLIALASRNSCASEWCQIELREAYQRNMPIILLFKEEVEECLMPPIMLAVFKKYTRAKLIINDGYFETVPEWNIFTQSVVDLAIDSHTEQ